MQEYPFGSVLSLRPLIDYLNKTLLNSDGTESCVLEDLTSKLAQTPELLEPIEDPTVLERRPDLLRTLMSPIFPVALLGDRGHYGDGAAKREGILPVAAG